MVQLVLQRLAQPGMAVAIAASIGASESTISRLKNDHLDTLCAVLAHAGLKLVPAEARVYAPEKVEALLTLAKSHLASVESAEDLAWDTEAPPNTS